MSRAMFAAKYGRPLLKAELELLDFYLYFVESKMIQKRKEKGDLGLVFGQGGVEAATPEQASIWEKGIDAAVEKFGDDICQIVLKAVKEHDAEKIIELAKAVWFFKDKLGSDFVHADAERSSLLLLKHQLQQRKLKVTVRQVAELLNGNRKVETPADGFSALRRKCKQLGVPLAESRKTSPK